MEQLAPRIQLSGGECIVFTEDSRERLSLLCVTFREPEQLPPLYSSLNGDFDVDQIGILIFI